MLIYLLDREVIFLLKSPRLFGSSWVAKVQGWMRSAPSAPSLWTDTPLQHCVAVEDSASGQAVPEWWALFKKGGSEDVLMEDFGRELADNGTSDLGGTTQISSWLWNTGRALYPPQGA